MVVVAVVVMAACNPTGDLAALLGVEHVVNGLGDAVEARLELLERAHASVEPAVDGLLIELLRLQNGAELLLGSAMVLAVVAHQVARFAERGANDLLLTRRGVEPAKGPVGAVAAV